MLKVLFVLISSSLNTFSMYSSLHYPKFLQHFSVPILGTSTILFYSLCVDLARDQLQNIMYYPITNLIFLCTFTICCIFSKFAPFRYYWPAVQIFCIFTYLLEEQSKVREIIYAHIENRKQIFILSCVFGAVFSCGIAHAGYGFLLSLLTPNKSDNYFVLPDCQTLQFEDCYTEHEHTIVDKISLKYKQITDIFSTSLIVVPILLTFLSLFFQFLQQTTPHSHSHYHKHQYFSQNSSHFRDVTNQSDFDHFLGILRIFSSAVIFHLALLEWNKQLNGHHHGSKHKKFSKIFFSLIIVLSRMFAQRK